MNFSATLKTGVKASTFPSEHSPTPWRIGIHQNRLLTNRYRIKEIEVVQEGTERIEYIKKFQDAGLHPAMLENVQLAGYVNPTPIQQYTIPAILQGKDVVGIAQTGMSFVSSPCNYIRYLISRNRVWEDSGLPYADSEQVDG